MSAASLISPPLTLAEIPQPQILSLGVLASGSGSNLEAIAQSIRGGALKARIQVLIYNQPGAGVKDRAERLGIPAVLLNHRDYASRADLDRAIVETLKQAGADWVIMAGWMRIVTPVLLDAFPRRVLNIHPSLLPSFRGVGAVEQALSAGVKVTGCTVHYAVPDVDSGPILAQAAVPILPGDTPESLHARVQVQEHQIFPLGIALAAQRERDI
ncbi:MAG: phosphoribosylglycinamide formyltransferase [Cyanobacteria bacterium RI_101]|nr:phosphoribosylglycinamide formyltransferase [Cyanobacteria bacterium RI_101]